MPARVMVTSSLLSLVLQRFLRATLIPTARSADTSSLPSTSLEVMFGNPFLLITGGGRCFHVNGGRRRRGGPLLLLRIVRGVGEVACATKHGQDYQVRENAVIVGRVSPFVQPK